MNIFHMSVFLRSSCSSCCRRVYNDSKCLTKYRAMHSAKRCFPFSGHGPTCLRVQMFSSSGRHSIVRVPQVPYGFRELGIRDPIVKAIENSFPDVRRPTIAQADFIPAILKGKDVLLHDETGTGKSFASIIALLNKPRARASHHLKRQDGSCITSLVIIPHRDLGFQMMHWIESILRHSGASSPALDSIAQLVVRTEAMPMEQQVRKLRTTPPHILLGTPQALWDIYRSDRRELQLENVQTLVVDEVDYLLDIPPPYVRKARESRAWKNFQKHPSLSRQLLEAVIPLRKHGAVRLGEIDYNDDSIDDRSKYSAMLETSRHSQSLQVVMSSATVHSNLTDFLCDARWLGGDRVILSGKQLLKENSHMVNIDEMQRPEIMHHAFVVSPDGSIENVESAVQPGEEWEPKDEDAREEKYASNHLEKFKNMKSVPPQSPTSPVVIEAIASVFAVDVPHLALLVISPGASVRKTIQELQDLGVDARPLDLRSQLNGRLRGVESEEEPEPILLVATPATIRGVDLPQLTHVFCAGAPDTTSADMFKHVAGRVGRFGRGGKVMTFVTEREVELRDGLAQTKKNPTGLLKAFYRKLQIKPARFDLSAVGIGK